MLSYDDKDGNAGEFFWYARNETNTFAKGFIGGGDLNGDSLDDEDYFSGQVNSPTRSANSRAKVSSTAPSMSVSIPGPGTLSLHRLQLLAGDGSRLWRPLQCGRCRARRRGQGQAVGSPDGNGRGRHPAGDLCGDEDSNLLRGDLGRPPNVEDRGIGWGYQFEAALRYDFTPGWSAGTGVRYWYAEVDGKASSSISTPRWVYGDVSYRF